MLAASPRPADRRAEGPEATVRTLSSATERDPHQHPGAHSAPGTAKDRARPAADHGRSRVASQSLVCARCTRTLVLPDASGARIGDPESIADLLVPVIGASDREHCVAVLLDTKHRVLDTVTVSIGSLDHTFMSPREIMRDALLANAAATVLAHNHPSGDPQPSGDDERVTRRLVEAGRLVGVEVLDHLVLGGGSWVSLARRGLV
jgi:DNA repair protein RadC